jgi:hypothetical protein
VKSFKKKNTGNWYRINNIGVHKKSRTKEGRWDLKKINNIDFEKGACRPTYLL